ncbi:MAG: hypothetical protein QX199_15330 [Methylococcaceae bacterium]
MTNKTKTIDIESLPLTERLTVARQLASSLGKPVLFNGLTVVHNTKSASDKARALAETSAINRLTMARAGQTIKPKLETEHTAPAGYFDGTGFVIFDDSIGVA